MPTFISVMLICVYVFINAFAFEFICVFINLFAYTFVLYIAIYTV